MQKLLIADSSEEFCQALAESLGDVFQIRVCSEGNRTLEMITSFCPDIVCLDLMMPGMDGVSILEQAADAGFHPAVLALSRHISDYTWSCLNRLSVSYAMKTPCALKAITARISDIGRDLIREYNDTRRRCNSGEELLAVLGVRSKLKGHECLLVALPIMMRDLGQPITKITYPAVAAKCGGTGTRVERAIRLAIEDAWKNRDESVWRLYFPSHVERNECPKNTEFIVRLAKCLLSGDAYLHEPDELQLSGTSVSA